MAEHHGSSDNADRDHNGGSKDDGDHSDGHSEDRSRSSNGTGIGLRCSKLAATAVALIVPVEGLKFNVVEGLKFNTEMEFMVMFAVTALIGFATVWYWT